MNRFAWLAVVCLYASSCAVGNDERRRVLNYLDENLAPASTTGRWLVSPVALPVGVCALATDAVVVHPLSQIDDAWVDTVDVVWDFDDSSEFRTVLLVPLRAVSTPVVFGVTWLFRSLFDIRDSVQPVEETERPSEPEPSSESSEGGE